MRNNSSTYTTNMNNRLSFPRPKNDREKGTENNLDTLNRELELYPHFPPPIQSNLYVTPVNARYERFPRLENARDKAIENKLDTLNRDLELYPHFSRPIQSNLYVTPVNARYERFSRLENARDKAIENKLDTLNRDLELYRHFPPPIEPNLYMKPVNARYERMDQPYLVNKKTLAGIKLEKSFNSFIPYNNRSEYESVNPKIRDDRLRTTEVAKVLKHKPSLLLNNEISIKSIIEKAVEFVGEVIYENERLGGCFQISPNLIVLPRHVIEGYKVPKIKVHFSAFATVPKTMHYASYSIEDSPNLDYAIVVLKNARDSDSGFLSLSSEIDEELVLLHYPLNSNLSVSSHAVIEKIYNESMIETYHDTDDGSSGGIYLNSKSEVVAIHLGCNPMLDSMNLLRYGLTLKGIIDQVEATILKKIYFDIDVKCVERKSFLEVKALNLNLEGRKFENKYKDNRKTMNSDEAMKKTISEVLKEGGRYGDVKQYSKIKKVEADHFPPKSVYKSAKDKKIQTLKPDNMAAITLRYSDHRNFETTGKKTANAEVREKMKKHFKEGEYYKAVRYNLILYQDKNLICNVNKGGILEALKLHLKNGLINNNQMIILIQDFSLSL